MSARGTSPRNGDGDRTDGRTPARTATEALPVGPGPAPARIVDPRAVRVSLGPASGHAELDAMVFEPAAVPLAPAPRIAGTGVLGGMAVPTTAAVEIRDEDGVVMVDGLPTHVRLDRSGPVHGRLAEGRTEPALTSVLMLPPEPARTRAGGPSRAGTLVREVVVDGWRFEIETESERRASLRERARRGREETQRGGPTEVHAIIPGVVVSVSVVAGDAVVAGQQLLVVEAMKMQNELRAPRDGVISRVAVGAGVTIEVGDLLLVLE